MKIFKMLKLPDYFSLLNVTSGMMSIYSSTRGNYLFSAIYLLFAVLFDFLDGKVARLTKKSSKLGFDIDSLADVISFGVAPAVMIITMFDHWLALISGFLIVICGLLRLARFNVTKLIDGSVYEGMPITFNGFNFALIYFISQFVSYGSNELYIYTGIAIISAYLMISTHRIKKII
ncbi:CDP-diacylglycerol--serine O-phosphatidyltransferase [archaeon]|jgi:CDP-diacylglycerol---serine O-phosphatidyltransferase|nr:CDP-diacylglycerol--serine O-phosphatidyltransferase [archaeon]MBT3720307.1 CDP-diacylglycerol--serine O-phosphatidyltransferase [archaeon]MBT4022961.1 CDP-diacylglycerol--serine O-phosphatidyltransferase [archaeon]MBT4271952.1 CDP-diacylglycerol--serine O-phosphatidyltransferase [archaeon]MBT4461790.1 CDP-diacylglycerol--serine O-phosphatidyltransferase [archaeon]